MQFSEYKKIVRPSEVHAFSFRTALAGRRVEESAHLTHDLSQDTAYQPTHLPSNSFFLVEPPGSPGRSRLATWSLPGFQNRQDFLGEECQTPLRDMVRRATEAEGDVPFEIAQ